MGVWGPIGRVVEDRGQLSMSSSVFYWVLWRQRRLKAALEDQGCAGGCRGGCESSATRYPEDVSRPRWERRGWNGNFQEVGIPMVALDVLAFQNDR